MNEINIKKIGPPACIHYYYYSPSPTREGNERHKIILLFWGLGVVEDIILLIFILSIPCLPPHNNLIVFFSANRCILLLPHAHDSILEELTIILMLFSFPLAQESINILLSCMSSSGR